VQVIDRDKHWAFGGKRPKNRQSGRTDGTPVQAARTWLLYQQGDRQGFSLWLRQLGQHAGDHWLEEIRQGGETQPSLGTNRPGRKYKTRRRRPVDSRLPDGRLADPGRPRKDQPGGASL
jgi:hypothetical protein